MTVRNGPTVLIDVAKLYDCFVPRCGSSSLTGECLKLARSVDQERLQSGSLILSIVISLLQ